jgi:hypothetical protein
VADTVGSVFVPDWQADNMRTVSAAAHTKDPRAKVIMSSTLSTPPRGRNPPQSVSAGILRSRSRLGCTRLGSPGIFG